MNFDVHNRLFRNPLLRGDLCIQGSDHFRWWTPYWRLRWHSYVLCFAGCGVWKTVIDDRMTKCEEEGCEEKNARMHYGMC